MSPIRCVLVMGVSGAGKTTLGELLAAHLSWDFFDGDDFHPAANRHKMASGQPLTDSDRVPWLQRLRQLIDERLAEPEPGAVIACSALKHAYRELLGSDRAGLLLAHLDGPLEVLTQRLRQRHNHFMPADLLASQLATLEPPADALRLDIRQTPETLCDIVAGIVARSHRPK